MKYLYSLLFILTLTSTAFSQYDLRAGMGIVWASTPSLTDYLNQNFNSPDQQLGTFNTAIVFSGEAGYMLNDHYEISFETAYLINSHTFTYSLGDYNLNYDIIMPSVLNYYVIKGNGFSFKFGGGLGLRFVSAKEHLPGIPVTTTYTSTGFGIVGRVDGNTILSGNLYANIGFDLRYDLNGEPKNGENYMVNNVYHKNVNFNSFSAGIRLGLTYLF